MWQFIFLHFWLLQLFVYEIEFYFSTIQIYVFSLEFNDVCRGQVVMALTFEFDDSGSNLARATQEM